MFDTVITSKFVHKIMIDTYIRLCMTHADLQINICFSIKCLTVNLLQVFFFYYKHVGIFPVSACDLALYFHFITF